MSQDTIELHKIANEMAKINSSLKELTAVMKWMSKQIREDQEQEKISQ